MMPLSGLLSLRVLSSVLLRAHFSNGKTAVILPLKKKYPVFFAEAGQPGGIRPRHHPLGAYFAGFTFQRFMTLSGKRGFTPEWNQKMILGQHLWLFPYDFSPFRPRNRQKRSPVSC
ncbi:hypothetical protein [Akkermansia sp.]|uniref:hypothetical protein n=1 Tax=Akkermansia sp. TaxID=1872421 RepID=UPI0025C4C073|nr:hypothetical protein [Akkermansia sp.]